MPIVASERFRLAREARAAALRVPGVAALDPGPTGMWVAIEHGKRVEGVICAATAAGGYEVSLRLVCQPVPLEPVGESVRANVEQAAAQAGLPLDRVTVHIADLIETEVP